MNPDDDIKHPERTDVPFAYTTQEGGMFQPWDEPPIGTANAIIWEDGRRWDRVNGDTGICFDQRTIADFKEMFRTEAAGETWWCKTHDRSAPHVHDGKHTCPPDADVEPRSIACNAFLKSAPIKAPERTRRYDPQPDVDPDAAGKTVMVGFRVASKKFSTCVNILAEALPVHIDTQALLRKALEVGHGITFAAEEDPELFFVINQDQMDALARVGASNPTWCQIIGTTEAVALTEDAAAERFRALKENQ